MKINNYYIFGGKIKLKLQENSEPLALTYAKDLKKYFPEVDLTPSS